MFDESAYLFQHSHFITSRNALLSSFAKPISSTFLRFPLPVDVICLLHKSMYYFMVFNITTSKKYTFGCASTCDFDLFGSENVGGPWEKDTLVTSSPQGKGLGGDNYQVKGCS